MNQTTEKSAFFPSLSATMKETIILWVLILTGAVVLNGIVYSLLGRVALENDFFLSLFPWVEAGGRSVSNGLSMFSGTTIPEIGMATKLSYLISVTCMFVLFPTLFLFGLRKRAAERASGSPLKPFRLSSIQLVAGGIVTMAVVLQSPTVFYQRQVDGILRSSQAVQESKDRMIDEINVIGRTLNEYRILPAQMGGGNRSYVGFHLDPGLVSTEIADYSIRPNDSSCTIIAVSKKYPQTTMSVVLSPDFNYRQWAYTGEFE